MVIQSFHFSDQFVHNLLILTILECYTNKKCKKEMKDCQIRTKLTLNWLSMAYTREGASFHYLPVSNFSFTVWKRNKIWHLISLGWKSGRKNLRVACKWKKCSLRMSKSEDEANEENHWTLVKAPQGKLNIPMCSCNLWTQNTALWISVSTQHIVVSASEMGCQDQKGSEEVREIRALEVNYRSFQLLRLSTTVRRLLLKRSDYSPISLSLFLCLW